MSNDLIFVQWSTPDAWHVMTDDRKYVLLGSPDENIRFEVNIDGSENKAGITGRNLFSDDPQQGYNPFLVQKLDKLSPISLSLFTLIILYIKVISIYKFY